MKIDLEKLKRALDQYSRALEDDEVDFPVGIGAQALKVLPDLIAAVEAADRFAEEQDWMRRATGCEECVSCKAMRQYLRVRHGEEPPE